MTRIVTRVDHPGVDTEELAARPVGEGRFIISSVPFTDTDLALGDIVDCVRVNGVWHVDSVVVRGGNSTLRILPAGPVDVLGTLLGSGCRVEQGPVGLLAVSIGPDAPYLGILTWLEGLVEDGLIDLSPGYTARGALG